MSGGKTVRVELEISFSRPRPAPVLVRWVGPTEMGVVVASPQTKTVWILRILQLALADSRMCQSSKGARTIVTALASASKCVKHHDCGRQIGAWFLCPRLLVHRERSPRACQLQLLRCQ